MALSMSYKQTGERHKLIYEYRLLGNLWVSAFLSIWITIYIYSNIYVAPVHVYVTSSQGIYLRYRSKATSHSRANYLQVSSFPYQVNCVRKLYSNMRDSTLRTLQPSSVEWLINRSITGSFNIHTYNKLVWCNCLCMMQYIHKNVQLHT